ncbi:MAG: helix-turn-helix transcriptional regulator [Clostridia bacterium]|nr:helix-turn-helix transcriptional regulator [Clostridia bacterium]
MSDLRRAIADNICALRTEAGMTQAQFAELFNYSDKAVSKWERGEAIPDVTVLKQIADRFGVTVDYLLRWEHTDAEERARHLNHVASRNRLLVTLISTVGVWVLFTLLFVLLALSEVGNAPWLLFIYAIPVSSVVVLVFNSIWGRRRLNFIIVSVLVWSILLSVYLTLLSLLCRNFWILFIIGIPAQVLLFFIPGITIIKKTKERDL